MKKKGKLEKERESNFEKKKYKKKGKKDEEFVIHSAFKEPFGNMVETAFPNNSNSFFFC